MANAANKGTSCTYDQAYAAIKVGMAAQSNRLAGGSFSQQDMVDAAMRRMQTESRWDPSTRTFTCTEDSWSGASGYYQMLPSYFNGNAAAVGSNKTWEDLSGGRVGLDEQARVYSRGFVTFAKDIDRQTANTDLTQAQKLDLVHYALNIGSGKGSTERPGIAGVISQTGLPLTRENFPKIKQAIQDSCNRQNHQDPAHSGGSASPIVSRDISSSPTTSTTVTYRPPDSVANAAQNATPVSPVAVIPDGLDNTPWWKVEGMLVGNPKLKNITDALSFRVRPYADLTRKPLTDSKGAPLVIRLNTGVSTFQEGSTHQDSIETTSTGLEVTIWSSKPDTITARGTTGLFLNQFGVTDYMSSVGSSEALGLFDAMSDAYEGSPGTLARKLQTDNKFRVAAQDAFMELLALFKNNGIQRILPMDYQYSVIDPKGGVKAVPNDKRLLDESAFSATAGLTGFQMRHRSGDVLQMGFVEMTYRGRVLLGQFKSLEWSVSAESPFRWDYSFTFRVMRELSVVYDTPPLQ